MTQSWNLTDALKDSDDDGVIFVPTEHIVIVNDDVLAQARLDLQRDLDRSHHSSREEWAKAVLASKEPVDLYLQRNGQLALLDGNHRYLAATILEQDLPCIVHSR
jgi:hypothetical protein